MFKKILIANRGEIAVRIAATCRAMGIASVAVFSDADRDALHVRVCEEAYPIGPSPASQSYLCGDKILEAARATGAQAIHPGYGFLSENASFARQVIDAGLVWIGPPPEAIDLMGSKIESKKLAERAGVPVVPGYMGEDQTVERLSDEVERLGFPVLIKASAGGGGKGMRVVRNAQQVRDSIEAAKREALAAFGDPALLLEKYLENPRHIEVQVLGDNYGNLVHLGERDCSIQRRHQKVVEESPSPVVTQALRERLTTAGLALARSAGYTNAGTVEFIFENGEFYFLEMNTRLQVEHPVTEEALGIDLVEAQVRIAAGEHLWFQQGDVPFKAHAIEVRLYAEDPEREFLPSTGRLSTLVFPSSARVDTGYTEGDEVSPYYDPMIAKIITRGQNRESAVLKMQEALGSMQVEGPRTNLDFLRWLFSNREFQRGEFTTAFIGRYFRPGDTEQIPPEVVIAAGALLMQAGRSSESDTPTSPYPWGSMVWRQARQDIVTRPVIDGQQHVCLFRANAEDVDGWQVEAGKGETAFYTARVNLRVDTDVAGRQGTIALRLGPENTLRTVSYTRSPASRGASSWQLLWEERSYTVRLAPALSTERLNVGVRPTSEDTLESPMPGKILKVLVKAGDVVAEEQPLVIVEAMKMEFTIRAPHEGHVAAVKYAEGSQVAVGDVLVELKK